MTLLKVAFFFSTSNTSLSQSWNVFPLIVYSNDNKVVLLDQTCPKWNKNFKIGTNLSKFDQTSFNFWNLFNLIEPLGSFGYLLRNIMKFCKFSISSKGLELKSFFSLVWFRDALSKWVFLKLEFTVATGCCLFAFKAVKKSELIWAGIF